MSVFIEQDSLLPDVNQYLANKSSMKCPIKTRFCAYLMAIIVGDSMTLRLKGYIANIVYSQYVYKAYQYHRGRISVKRFSWIEY